jgi:hypothetical protein
MQEIGVMLMEPPTTLPVEFVFNLRLTGAAQPEYVFDTPWGGRRETRARGGSFAGPRLSGSVVQGLANDWGAVTQDGIVGFDANLVLKTEDGEPLFMTFRGRANASGQYRIAPQMEASHGPLAWLTEIQYIGVGGTDGDDLVFDIYAIK